MQISQVAAPYTDSSNHSLMNKKSQHVRKQADQSRQENTIEDRLSIEKCKISTRWLNNKQRIISQWMQAQINIEPYTSWVNLDSHNIKSSLKIEQWKKNKMIRSHIFAY